MKLLNILLSIPVSSSCSTCDVQTSNRSGKDLSAGQSFEIKGDVLIGTDGAGSDVRRAICRSAPICGLTISQVWLDHGYKELEIPPGKITVGKLKRNALHIWPRQSFMVIALPTWMEVFT
jgi:kynurenine 3-monooxygenase